MTLLSTGVLCQPRPNFTVHLSSTKKAVGRLPPAWTHAAAGVVYFSSKDADRSGHPNDWDWSFLRWICKNSPGLKAYIYRLHQRQVADTSLTCYYLWSGAVPYLRIQINISICIESYSWQSNNHPAFRSPNSWGKSSSAECFPIFTSFLLFMNKSWTRSAWWFYIETKDYEWSEVTHSENQLRSKKRKKKGKRRAFTSSFWW